MAEYNSKNAITATAASIKEGQEITKDGMEERLDVLKDYEAQPYTPAEVLAVLSLINTDLEDWYKAEWADFDNWTENQLTLLKALIGNSLFNLQTLEDWIKINEYRLHAKHAEEDAAEERY